MRAPWEINQLPRAVFDPTTLAIAAIGTTVIGGISSAGAQMQQAEQAKAFGNWNRQVYEQQANQVTAEANARAEIAARDNARKLGQIKAAYGAAGVDLQGTPLEVLNDQASELELQRQLGLYQGQTQAISLRQRGALASAQGDAAASAGYTAAGTTLLTTAASAGMNAYMLSTIPGKSPYPVSPATSAFPPGTRPVYN